jgi:hypothetical protein
MSIIRGCWRHDASKRPDMQDVVDDVSPCYVYVCMYACSYVQVQDIAEDLKYVCVCLFVPIWMVVCVCMHVCAYAGMRCRPHLSNKYVCMI